MHRGTDRARCYLDHAGAGLPSSSQLRACFDSLVTGGDGTGPVIAANPHSLREAEEEIRRARYMVLSFIGADPVEYEVIFTSGATAAIKLVGDALAWGSNHDNRDRSGHKTLLAYAKNSHTSVLGLRDLFSRAFCIDGDLTSPGAELVEVTADRYERRLTEPADDGSSHIGLIVTPGECNFSGAKLDLVQTAQQVHLLGQRLLKVGPRSRCLWMLDIAKLASTSRIDISTQISDPLLRPDFMCLSFYKIFGYPTGLGALIVKRSVAPLMRRRYWGGGTVDAAAADSPFCVLRGEGRSGRRSRGLEPNTYEGIYSPQEDSPKRLNVVDDSLALRFEDGTPHFLGIRALRFGFEAINAFGGMQVVQSHTFRLALRIREELRTLRHRTYTSHAAASYRTPCKSRSDPCTGREWAGEVCEVYGWDIVDTDHQGSIVSFNVIDAWGHYVPFSEVGRQALETAGIVLRTGCFCNVGACQMHLKISAADAEANYATGRRCGGADGLGDIINGRPTGAVRVSVGYMSTDTDVDTLIEFIRNEYVNKGFKYSETVQNYRIEPPKAAPQLVSSDLSIDETSESEYYTLNRIYIYPIKSCVGVRVSQWPLSDNGLFLDREWAVVDELSRRVLTQKLHPRMALIETRLDLDAGELVVSTPSMSSELRLAVSSHACVVASGHQRDGDPPNISSDPSNEVIMVCQQPRAVSQGAVRGGSGEVYQEANEWLSLFLGTRCRLQRRAPPCLRPAEECGRRVPTTGEDIVNNFVNEAQFLMITEASLGLISKLVNKMAESSQGNLMQEFDDKGSERVTFSDWDVARFRPNLVLGRQRRGGGDDSVGAAASDAFQEDGWSRLSYMHDTHSCSNFRVTGPCARCSMINVDQSKGVMDGRYLQTLGAYRRLSKEDGGADRAPKGVSFGQFLCMEDRLQSMATLAAPSLYAAGTSYTAEDDRNYQVECTSTSSGGWFEDLILRAKRASRALDGAVQSFDSLLNSKESESSILLVEGAVCTYQKCK